jgi:hypothetical protein
VPSRLLRADVTAQEGLVQPPGKAIGFGQGADWLVKSVRRRQSVGCDGALLIENVHEKLPKSGDEKKRTCAEGANIYIVGTAVQMWHGAPYTFWVIRKTHAVLLSL